MFAFSRLSKSRIANWWWTVDKVTLSLVLILIFIGAFLVFSASPSVARRIGYADYHFIKRQIVFILVSLVIIVALSMQRLKTIRRIAIIGYVLTLCLMALIKSSLCAHIYLHLTHLLFYMYHFPILQYPWC